MRSRDASSKAPRRRPFEKTALLKAPPLDLSFYQGPSPEVAKQLLGKGLVVGQGQSTLAVQIVEVEAYFQEDPASHSFSGPTSRNSVMFEEGGRCYVYLSYGIHYCMNVVTGKKGHGDACLLRAAEPLLGLERMRRNRGLPPDTPDSHPLLLNGPGKLCQALAVNPTFNGRSFRDKAFKLIDLGVSLEEEEIGTSPRVGISKAKHELLRYFIRSSRWVSKVT